MRKIGLLGTSAIRSAFFMAAFAVATATPSYAQDVQEEEDDPATLQGETELESGEDASAGADGSAAADAGQEITVTGSRIRRPNLDATVPITSVGSEVFRSTGQIAVGDILNELPALRSTFSTANSTRFIGTSGLSLLDLRGLGTDRTLVLMNGRRMVPASIGGSAPDVNIVPTDLLERVDVVTGGNSAIYGSDAIAGVVNFVMKRDFEGLQLRGQGGISSRGDAGAYFVSGIAGMNFGGDRGNIAVSGEFARQNIFFPIGRGDMAVQSGFLVVDSDSTPSDGNPDRIFVRNITSLTISDYGLLTPSCSNTTPAALRPIRCLVAAPNANGTFDNRARVYGFGPDGQLLVQDPYNADFRPLSNNTIGGIGTGFRSREDLNLRPMVERINFNAFGHFTLSEAFEPFFEAGYARIRTSGGQSGPSFFQGGTFGTLRIDNPFLSDQSRNLIQQFAGPTATTFALSRNNFDIGNRDYPATRETMRGVVGIRGDFNDDWRYEVSANYGKFDEIFRPQGQFNRQRFAYALDAVKDANGNIVCRVTVDPAARVVSGGLDPDDPAAQARIAGDVAACVPFNPFGATNSPAAIAYVAPELRTEGKQTQFVANAFVSGDSSDMFELPGGPIGFALGAEYRKETAYQRYDEITESGGTFLNAIPIFDPPAFEVKEAFGEIRVPILRDVPFFHELTLEAAGRVADYNGATGTVFAWNAGGTWAPVPDIRFRGNYSRAVRAPNLSELYSSQTQNFAPAFLDPCHVGNINGNQIRQQNCIADGVPLGTPLLYTSSLEILSGGNPDLTEETSTSWTLGAVFTPRWVRGLSITVDYYDIFVDKVITAPTAQAIVNACYDGPAGNSFCDLFERFPAGTEGDPPGSQNGEFFIKPGLQQTQLNYAGLAARGVDVELAYRRKFAGVGDVSARFTGTYVLQRDQFLFPDTPDIPDQVLYETGDPKIAFNFSLDWTTGPYTIGYQMRYLGKQLIVGNLAENIFPVQPLVPGGPPTPLNPDFSQFNWFSDVMYHDIRLGFDAGDKFEFYMGVENIFDRLPEFGNTGVGVGSAIFDNRGRYFYAGAIAKF
jgi:outer membrane receptor protein involved in Fe transport